MGLKWLFLHEPENLSASLHRLLQKNIELRIAQFGRYHDGLFRLSLSKAIVKGKLNNCLAVIKSFSVNHPETDLSGEITFIESSANNIETAESIPSLLGVEGSAAKSYFSGFGKMMLGSLTFAGRKKHPSTDPVNALLSFGYTLVFNEISSLLDGLGFDPYLGYFHTVEYGRASL